MTIAATPRGYLERPRPSGLADVVDVILDKGLVIDAYVRVALVGIELLTVDARIVVASVDTYLRFAAAVNRLEIGGDEAEGLPQLMSQLTSGGAESKTEGALKGVKDEITGDGSDGHSGHGALQRVRQKLSGDDDPDEQDDEEDQDDEDADGGQPRRRRSGESRSRSSSRGSSGSTSRSPARSSSSGRSRRKGA